MNPQVRKENFMKNKNDKDYFFKASLDKIYTNPDKHFLAFSKKKEKKENIPTGGEQEEDLNQRPIAIM